MLVEGTRAPHNRMRATPDVLVESISQTSFDKDFIIDLSKIMAGIGPIIAGVKGVVYLGLAIRCGIRVYRLTSTAEKMGDYPEYTFKSIEGEALFARLTTYYTDESKSHCKSATKGFLEATVRLLVPTSVFLSLGFAAESFLSGVLARYWEARDVELTNHLLEMAKCADDASAFYEIIRGGHIVIPAYVANSYQAKDLSNARRIYAGEAERAKELREGADYLKRRAKDIYDDSRYEVKVVAAK